MNECMRRYLTGFVCVCVCSRLQAARIMRQIQMRKRTRFAFTRSLQRWIDGASPETNSRSRTPSEPVTVHKDEMDHAIVAIMKEAEEEKRRILCEKEEAVEKVRRQMEEMKKDMEAEREEWARTCIALL